MTHLTLWYVWYNTAYVASDVPILQGLPPGTGITLKHHFRAEATGTVTSESATSGSDSEPIGTWEGMAMLVSVLYKYYNYPMYNVCRYYPWMHSTKGLYALDSTYAHVCYYCEEMTMTSTTASIHTLLRTSMYIIKHTYKYSWERKKEANV